MSSVLPTVPWGQQGQEAGLRVTGRCQIARCQSCCSLCVFKEEGRSTARERGRQTERGRAQGREREGERESERPLEPRLEQSEHSKSAFLNQRQKTPLHTCGKRS